MKKNNTYECKHIYYYDRYFNMIEEAKTEFQLAHRKKVIDWTLSKIEQEAGSLKLDDVAQVAVRKYGPCPNEDEGYLLFNKYIKEVVMGYLNKKGMVQTFVKMNDNVSISRNVLDGIFNLLAEMVVDDIRHMLVQGDKKNKKKKEAKDAEVK